MIDPSIDRNGCLVVIAMQVRSGREGCTGVRKKLFYQNNIAW